MYQTCKKTTKKNTKTTMPLWKIELHTRLLLNRFWKRWSNPPSTFQTVRSLMTYNWKFMTQASSETGSAAFLPSETEESFSVPVHRPVWRSNRDLLPFHNVIYEFSHFQGRILFALLYMRVDAVGVFMRRGRMYLSKTGVILYACIKQGQVFYIFSNAF